MARTISSAVVFNYYHDANRRSRLSQEFPFAEHRYLADGLAAQCLARALKKLDCKHLLDLLKTELCGLIY